jgi:hypothetical protein
MAMAVEWEGENGTKNSFAVEGGMGFAEAG